MRSKKSVFLIAVAVIAVLILLCEVLILWPDSVTEAPEVEIKTVRILTIGETSEESLQRVSEALSEITLEQLGCKVELRMIGLEEYDARIDDLLLESDFADIFVCRNRTTMNKLLEGNYIYRLDRYLEDFPEFWQVVPEESAWVQTDVNGYIYGIPFGNETQSDWGFLMRQDVCDALGIKPETVTTLDELYKVLLRVHSAYPDMIPVVSDRGQMETFTSADLLISGGGCLVTEAGAVNVCELPEFRARCEVMRQWNEAGLLQDNAPFNTESVATWMESGLAFGAFVEANRYTVRDLEYTLDIPVTYAQLNDTFYKDGVSDMSFAVYAYTEDVNRCLQVLRLIYTDPDVLQLCIYGQEGVDYMNAENGAVKPVVEKGRDERYINLCWALRDNASAPITPEDPDWYDEDVNADGFLFDNRSVSNEIYQCSEILEKYFSALCSGMIDAQEGISMMAEELETANMETVRTELERQQKEWLQLN